jgi:hypothetical protein
VADIVTRQNTLACNDAAARHSGNPNTKARKARLRAGST